MELIAPELRRLCADWNERRFGRFPKRADFDPRDFKYILGRLSLIDIHRDPLRFFYRIHGSDVARRVGLDLTGKFIDDAREPEHRDLALRHFVMVAETGEPSVMLHRQEMVGDQVWNFEALVLPLSRDGETLDMLLNGIVYHKSKNAGAEVGIKSLQLLSEDDAFERAMPRFAQSR